MRATRALYAAISWAAVAAFVPAPNVQHSRFACASAAADGKRPTCSSSLKSRKVSKADVASYTPAKAATASIRRATAPVVLVGPDSAVLNTFAQHLAAADGASIANLGDVARSDGARGVEIALAGSKTNGVLVCPSTLCLDHPDVTSLILAHPLTVHLAAEGEDKDTRKRCERATKYTVVVDDGEEGKGYAKADLSRLVAFARKSKPSSEDVALDMGKNTFFLSLTFEDFEPHKALLPDLTEGVDAMELRVDLLANHNPYSVLRQLSILRRYTGYLPVVFTIRSKGQCGAFPDDPEALFRLARWGLRAGCEVMDVEANWPMSYREGLIREADETYPGAMVVGSYHVVGRKTTEEQARALFMECYHDGAVDAVKVPALHTIFGTIVANAYFVRLLPALPLREEGAQCDALLTCSSSVIAHSGDLNVKARRICNCPYRGFPRTTVEAGNCDRCRMYAAVLHIRM